MRAVPLIGVGIMSSAGKLLQYSSASVIDNPAKLKLIVNKNTIMASGRTFTLTPSS
jgi:hypothetical protein